MRVGHGYDVHCFSDRGDLVLGGVSIPFDRGLEAHSDGDVLLHAVCDALLGAAALGDIGQHFPDSDPRFSNIDSRKLLRHVYALIFDAGYRLGNLDITVVAQVPRLATHIPRMRALIAADLDADETQVNVKATTTEHLGFVGREEGIATHAVCMLVSRKPDIDSDEIFDRIYDDV